MNCLPMFNSIASVTTTVTIYSSDNLSITRAYASRSTQFNSSKYQRNELNRRFSIFSLFSVIQIGISYHWHTIIIKATVNLLLTLLTRKDIAFTYVNPWTHHHSSPCFNKISMFLQIYMHSPDELPNIYSGWFNLLDDSRRVDMHQEILLRVMCFWRLFKISESQVHLFCKKWPTHWASMPMQIYLFCSAFCFSQTTEIENDAGVRDVSIEKRQCRFPDERWPLNASLPYSFNSCLIYTRIQIELELCNCTLHFAPIECNGLLHSHKDVEGKSKINLWICFS